VPEVEQPDVRALQTELVAQLRAAGLGELLYAHALKLFDHFKEAGAKERCTEAATPGGTNAQPSATRPLAPFFAEGYGKAHPDLFEDVGGCCSRRPCGSPSGCKPINATRCPPTPVRLRVRQPRRRLAGELCS